MKNLNKQSMWTELIENEDLHTITIFNSDRIVFRLKYEFDTFSMEFIHPTIKNIKTDKIKNSKGVWYEFQEVNDVTQLIITLRYPDLLSYFESFSENLFSSLDKESNQYQNINGFYGAITKWKFLFEKDHVQALSKEKQLGLVGELLSFHRFCENNYSTIEVLEAWKGPENDSVDFHFNEFELEVKASAMASPSIHISSERQLDSENYNSFYLIFFALKRSSSKLKFTLPELIQKTYELNSDLGFQNILTEKLQGYGYFQEHDEVYKDYYDELFSNFYKIKEDFPLLSHRNIPNGISKVKYDIDLSACKTFEIDFFKQ